jgi:hypothetical protein
MANLRIESAKSSTDVAVPLCPNIKVSTHTGCATRVPRRSHFCVQDMAVASLGARIRFQALAPKQRAPAGIGRLAAV